MKSFTKLLVVLLALCQLLCLFSACNQEGGEQTSETTAEESASAMNKENFGKYVIVVPDAKATELKNIVAKLQTMIKQYTGHDLALVTDATAPAEYEILVGEVNRDEIPAFYESVKENDYGYAMIGKKILLVGCDNKMIEKSIWLFIPEVVGKMDESDSLLKDGAKEIYTFEEPVDEDEAWIEASKQEYYCEALERVTVNALGDSYFEGNGIGKENTWLGLLGKKYKMVMNNYGKGGSTVSNKVNKNPMCERYMNMSSKADIILVEGGRNDFNQEVVIGNAGGTDTTTFSGALNVIIDGLQEKYPNAMIVCISNWNFPGTKNGNNYSDFANAMKAVANDQGVYFIEACNPSVSGVDMTNELFRAKYCIKESDISHLNEAGMKLVMPYFEKALAACYTDFLSKK